MARALTQRHRDTEVAKVRLGEVATYVNGYAFKPSDWTDVGDVIVRIQDLTGTSSKANRFAGEIANKYRVNAGDVLISWSASLGVYIWQHDAAWLNQHIFKVVFDKLAVDKSYFVHQVGVILNFAIGNAHGCTMRHLTKPVFDALPFRFPPLAEQKRIAGELDRICELKKNAEERLALMDQLVKSKFVEMFGDVTFNEKGWPVEKFGDVTDSRLGKMLDAKKQTGLHKRKYLANFNVQWFEIDTSELHEMDFDESDREEFALKDGDLLVCEGGESGRCCVWRNQIEDCYYQKALHRVRCHSDKLNPDFLSYWFLMSCIGHAFDHIIGAKATIAHLPGVKLKALNIAIPPLSLQREFAAFAESVDKSKAALKETIATMETLYKERLQEYFS